MCEINHVMSNSPKLMWSVSSSQYKSRSTLFFNFTDKSHKMCHFSVETDFFAGIFSKIASDQVDKCTVSQSCNPNYSPLLMNESQSLISRWRIHSNDFHQFYISVQGPRWQSGNTLASHL